MVLQLHPGLSDCVVFGVGLQGGAGAILGAARALAQLQPEGVEVGRGRCNKLGSTIKQHCVGMRSLPDSWP